MANNRMYLRCLWCGESWPLAKWYPSVGWFMPEGRQEDLNAWFADHQWPHGEKYTDHPEGWTNGRWYELIYEDRDA